MGTLIVIPTYNERENLRPVVDAVLAAEPSVDLLIIDDNSPDGTGRIADDLAATTTRVRALHRPGKLGLASAYRTGLEHGLAQGYEFIVIMDADRSHRPEHLPAMLAAAADADLVIGSRNVRGGRALGWSPLRHLISRGGSLYARSLLRLPISDCTSGYRCFRAAALETLNLNQLRSRGYAFNVEINHASARAGLRIAEVPIIFPDRIHGASKMTPRIVAEAALIVLRLAFRSPPADRALLPAASSLKR